MQIHNRHPYRTLYRTDPILTVRYGGRGHNTAGKLLVQAELVLGTYQAYCSRTVYRTVLTYPYRTPYREYTSKVRNGRTTCTVLEL